MVAKTWAGDKGTGKVDTFWFNPKDVVVVTDPNHPSKLYRKSAKHKPRADLIALFGAVGWSRSSVVVLRKDGDDFLVAAGNDRVISLLEYNRLALAEGKEEVLMLCIRQDGGPEQVAGVTAVENMGRRVLDPVEMAEGWARLLATGKSERTVAEMEGISLAELKSKMKVLEVSPTARAKIKSGDLPPSSAPMLARQSSEKQEEIVATLPPKAGVREVTAAVRQVKATKEAAKEGRAAPVVRVAPKTKDIRWLITALRANEHEVSAEDALDWALGTEIEKDAQEAIEMWVLAARLTPKGVK